MARPLATKVRNAASAGALAVLVYGTGLPAGGLALEESSSIPVVALPAGVGRQVVAGRAQGWEVRVSITPGDEVANDAAGRVAPFSSEGPAFEGSVKPDLVAPGVAIPTADAGTAADGTPRYATVTGSSAAAAAVAGVAALVAEARPELDAAELAGAIAGTSTPLTVDGLPESVTRQGAGLVDADAAAAAEIVVDAGPTVPGDETSGVWASERTLRVTNVSDHPLSVAFGFVTSADSRVTPVLTADPGSLELEPGASGKVVLAVSSREAARERVRGNHRPQRRRANDARSVGRDHGSDEAGTPRQRHRDLEDGVRPVAQRIRPLSRSAPAVSSGARTASASSPWPSSSSSSELPKGSGWAY